MTSLAVSGSVLGMTLSPLIYMTPYLTSWKELPFPPFLNSSSEVVMKQDACRELYHLHQLFFIDTTMIKVTVTLLGQVNVRFLTHHQIRKKNQKLDFEFVGKVAWVGSLCIADESINLNYFHGDHLTKYITHGYMSNLEIYI